MRLESVTLSGFRCFEPDPLKVSLSPAVTAVVGPNAARKTLCKVFGVSRAERNIQRADFHLAADAGPDDRTTKDLVIDVLVAPPELADGTATPETVAPSFRHRLISRGRGAGVPHAIGSPPGKTTPQSRAKCRKGTVSLTDLERMVA